VAFTEQAIKQKLKVLLSDGINESYNGRFDDGQAYDERRLRYSGWSTDAKECPIWY